MSYKEKPVILSKDKDRSDFFYRVIKEAVEQKASYVFFDINPNSRHVSIIYQIDNIKIAVGSIDFLKYEKCKTIFKGQLGMSLERYSIGQKVFQIENSESIINIRLKS